jgi:hypothetical protein
MPFFLGAFSCLEPTSGGDCPPVCTRVDPHPSIRDRALQQLIVSATLLVATSCDGTDASNVPSDVDSGAGRRARLDGEWRATPAREPIVGCGRRRESALRALRADDPVHERAAARDVSDASILRGHSDARRPCRERGSDQPRRNLLIVSKEMTTDVVSGCPEGLLVPRTASR